MQFKTIAAILLGVNATGALAGPVAQPDAAIQARADQAQQNQQVGQAQQAGQAKQAGEAKAGKQDYDPEDYDDDDYNNYGDRYQQGGLDPYSRNGYRNGYNNNNNRWGNRWGGNGYGNNRYNNGYNYGRPYRGNQGGYGRGGQGQGGYGQQDHCPLQSCCAPNGCDGFNGFCVGGINAGCPCFE